MRMGKAKAETTKSTGPVSRERDREEEISNFGQIISHSGIRDRRIRPPPPGGRSMSERADWLQIGQTKIIRPMSPGAENEMN